MSPTTRNRLMIGGALIVIALLLTCGPMTNWFGFGNTKVGETPDVAAAPPAEDVKVDANVDGALNGATAGAIAGAHVGTTDLSALDARDADLDATGTLAGAGLGLADGTDSDLNGIGGTASRAKEAAAGSNTKGNAALVAGAGLGAGAAVAAGTALGTAGSGAGSAAAGAGAAAGGAGAGTAAGLSSAVGAGLPAVSAGVPDTAVANSLAAEAAGLGAVTAAAAAGAFDSAFGPTSIVAAGDGVAGNAQEGPLSAAGKVVDRFAPPVAAVGGSGLSLAAAGGAFGIQAGGVRAACDSPGAGCQNIRGATVGGGGRPTPPIIGGVRPTPPGTGSDNSR